MSGKILTNVTGMIGTTILNISSQDYESQGSSVTILVVEKSMVPAGGTENMVAVSFSTLSLMRSWCNRYEEYMEEVENVTPLKM